MLRADPELLWTKDLPSKGPFAPNIASAGKDEYLIFTDGNDKRHCHGSDAITSSYRDWTKPPALIQAIANLGADQKTSLGPTPTMKRLNTSCRWRTSSVSGHRPQKMNTWSTGTTC